MSQLRDQSDIAKTVRGLKTGPRNAADTDASICVPANATFGSSETRSQFEVVEFHVKRDVERICPRRPVTSIMRFAVIPPIDWPLTFPESVSTYARKTSRPARRGSHRGGGTEPFVGGRGRRRSGRIAPARISPRGSREKYAFPATDIADATVSRSPWIWSTGSGGVLGQALNTRAIVFAAGRE